MTPALVLRQLRIGYVAFFASAAIYVLIGERLVRPQKQPSTTTFLVLAFLAVWAGVAGVLMRRKFLAVAVSMLRQEPANLDGLKKWRVGQFIMLACSEAVVLYGLVVRFLGFGLRRAAPFYVGGFLLLALAWPKPAIDPTESFTGRTQT